MHWAIAKDKPRNQKNQPNNQTATTTTKTKLTNQTTTTKTKPTKQNCCGREDSYTHGDVNPRICQSDCSYYCLYKTNEPLKCVGLGSWIVCPLNTYWNPNLSTSICNCIQIRVIRQRGNSIEVVVNQYDCCPFTKTKKPYLRSHTEKKTWSRGSRGGGQPSVVQG